jgi:hypothetical protein
LIQLEAGSSELEIHFFLLAVGLTFNVGNGCQRELLSWAGRSTVDMC